MRSTMYKFASNIVEIEEVKVRNKYIDLVYGIVYAMEYWGPNNNGDAFPFDQMIKTYKLFETVDVHLEHNMDDKIGYVKKASIDYDMKRIVVEISVDTTLLPREAYDRIMNRSAIGHQWDVILVMMYVPYVDTCPIVGQINANILRIQISYLIMIQYG